jgi:hypothetical protein
LIAYIIMYARQSLQLLGMDRNQGALYLALLFQQVITNLSETHWFSVLSVDFVIMTLATTALARSLLEHRLRLIFGDRIPIHAVGGWFADCEILYARSVTPRARQPVRYATVILSRMHPRLGVAGVLRT